MFLHGTTIMHAAGLGRARTERVRQVLDAHPTVADFASYVPIENAPQTLAEWVRQGAEIVYLSSHRRPEGVAADRLVLRRYGFPTGAVVFRTREESYADVVARVAPDVIVEDDCESIGGTAQMTHPRLPAPFQDDVVSVVVPEFGGIDSVAERVSEIMRTHRPEA